MFFFLFQLFTSDQRLSGQRQITKEKCYASQLYENELETCEKLPIVVCYLAINYQCGVLRISSYDILKIAESAIDGFESVQFFVPFVRHKRDLYWQIIRPTSPREALITRCIICCCITDILLLSPSPFSLHIITYQGYFSSSDYQILLKFRYIKERNKNLVHAW